MDTTSISIGLADALSVYQNNQKSLSLKVTCDGISGSLWIDKGNVVHARVKDLTGTKALAVFLKWPHPVLVEESFSEPPARSVTGSTTKVLLDILSSEDEKSKSMNDTANLDKAVEIGKNVWWVGHRKAGSPLQVNVYLKKFDGSAMKKADIWLLIDPGGQLYFPDISRRISEIVDISRIQLFSSNHQDPDVCSNGVYITEMNPNAICITSETTARLLVHYGIRKFRFVEELNWKLNLVTGHQLKFFPTPFCHFSGAFGIYDPESRIVFTGDLFGGTSIKAVDAPLYAREEDWDDVATFHSIYMPSSEAIKYSIDKMRKTIGTPEIIASQHGGIIRGSLVSEWMTRLENLPVGIDLLKKSDMTSVFEYIKAANDILDTAALLLPGFTLDKLFTDDKSLATYFTMDKDRTKFGSILREPARAIAELQKALIFNQDRGITGAIKAAVVRAMHKRQLSLMESGTKMSDESVIENEDVISAPEK